MCYIINKKRLNPKKDKNLQKNFIFLTKTS